MTTSPTLTSADTRRWRTVDVVVAAVLAAAIGVDGAPAQGVGSPGRRPAARRATSPVLTPSTSTDGERT